MRRKRGEREVVGLRRNGAPCIDLALEEEMNCNGKIDINTLWLTECIEKCIWHLLTWYTFLSVNKRQVLNYIQDWCSTVFAKRHKNVHGFSWTWPNFGSSSRNKTTQIISRCRKNNSTQLVCSTIICPHCLQWSAVHVHLAVWWRIPRDKHIHPDLGCWLK